MVSRGSRVSLSVQEKIVLHLGEFRNLKGEFVVPYELTQDGIAAALQIERSNLPRELKRLEDRGFIEEHIAHVHGRSRRRKAYFLTPDGKVHANQIKGHLKNVQVIYNSPDGKKIKVFLMKLYSDLKPEIGLIGIINKISQDGEFDHYQQSSPEPELVVEKPKPIIVEQLEKAPKAKYFFGRLGELKKISHWLREQDYKVIVIYGFAGIGKTTLVSQVVNQYKTKMSTYWYRCHESDTIKTIITPISQFISKFEKFRLIEYLNNKKIINVVEISDILEDELKDINAIFVFDDFQKVDKTIIQLFSILLDTIEKLSGTKIIISTRRLVPFYGPRETAIKKTVVELQLQGLDKESSRELLKSQRTLEVDDTKFENIYESTAGHPLALELLSPISELDRKSDFTRFIEDEIFSELNVEHKNILNAASVYRYPIDPPGFFVDKGTTYDHLSELLKRSLVYKLANNQYDLHDLVREFVLSHLTGEQKRYYHFNASQYYSVRAGLDSAVEVLYHQVHAKMFKDAAKLATEKGQEIIAAGHLELKYILDEFEMTELSDVIRSEVVLLKGDVAFAMGDLVTAFEQYEEGLKLMLRTGKRSASAKVYRKMAVLFSYQNNWSKAIEFYNKALKIFQGAGDTKELAKIYNNLALAYYNREDHEKTLDFYKKSVELLTKLDEKKGITITYNNLGKIFEDKKQYKKALEYYNKSLSISKTDNDTYGIASAYSHIGGIELKRDNLKNAGKNFEKCMELINNSGYDQESAMLAIDIANLYYDKQEFKSALKYYETGLQALRELQTKVEYKSKSISFWQKYFWKDTISEHIEDLQESMQQFSQINVHQDKMAKIYNKVGNINRALDNWPEAIKNHETALGLFRSVGDLRKIAMAYTDLGIDYSNFGDHEKALYYYRKCYTLLKGTGDNIGLAVTLNNIGKLYENENQFKKAMQYYKKSLKVSQRAHYKTGIKKANDDIDQIKNKVQ